MSVRLAPITSDRYTFVSHSRIVFHVLLHAVSSHLVSIIAIPCWHVCFKLLRSFSEYRTHIARVVLQLRRRDHITPALVQLHWLPLRHRVTFKIATITFNLLKFHRPSYTCISLFSRIHSI